MSKTLVAYFSATGTTARVAQSLADELGADIFRIKPKVPYDSADLDWNDKTSRSTVEMTDPNARPEIASGIDISSYDRIFIGSPIWWYVAPRIINTFLESADFSGKKVYYFATSGGSGLGKTVDELKKSCPSLISGKMLNRPSEIKSWIKSLN